MKLSDLKKMQSFLKTTVATKDEISFFQKKNKFILPNEMIDYFMLLNGTSNEYDDRFFKFYSLAEFRNIREELGEWEGAPDYRNIINTLKTHESCFVFADYNCHLFSYGIQLYENESMNNEIYVICGDKYDTIAKSFYEFVDLYINDSPKLYMG